MVRKIKLKHVVVVYENILYQFNVVNFSITITLVISFCFSNNTVMYVGGGKAEFAWQAGSCSLGLGFLTVD